MFTRHISAMKAPGRYPPVPSHLPRLPADGREGACPATVQLVAPPGADDLKVERLIELSKFF